MGGNLAQFPVTEILRDVHARGDSAVLSFSNGRTTKRVYFKRGAIVFASSTASEERLGERLVRAGKLKRADLDLACRVRESSRLRLGTTLVDMGYLTRAELDERVREQVEHIVLSVLPWEQGEFLKELKAEPVDADLERKDISTLNLLLDGVRGIESADVIRRGIGELDRPVRYAADPKTLDQSLRLTPEEGFVLSRVDGSSSAGEIARLSPMGEQQTLRCLWALVAVGLLEVERTRRLPAGERAPEKVSAGSKLSDEAHRLREEMLEKNRRAHAMTHYELLNVRPGAKDEEIKAAYLDLAKRLHPDHRSGLALDDAEGMFDELYLKATAAYETLSDEAKRRRYDSTLERGSEVPRGERVPGARGRRKNAWVASERTLSSEKLGRGHYANAERYFDAGEYHEAIQELRAAIRHDGSRAQYHRLLARALAKNPKWRKHAEEHYQKALAMNRFDGDSYFELGELYESLGLSTRARRMFEEAVALDPDNLRALEKIREPLQRDRKS